MDFGSLSKGVQLAAPLEQPPRLKIEILLLNFIKKIAKKSTILKKHFFVVSGDDSNFLEGLEMIF